MIVVKNNLIPFSGFIAITLWPFIFVRKSSASRFSDVTLRHEKIHSRQQLETLLILFPILYITEYLIRFLILRDANRAYRAISFEQEAYTNEHNTDYIQTRRNYAWFRFLMK